MRISGSMKRLSKKIAFRTTSLMLVLVLVFSTVMGTIAYASRITFEHRLDGYHLRDAAHRYIARYVDTDMSLWERMWDYVNGADFTQTQFQRLYRSAVRNISRMRFRNALRDIETAIVLYEGENTEMKVALWMKKGSLHILVGEYDAASAALDRVLEFEPMIADVFLLKAQAYQGMEHFDEMLESLERYLALTESGEISALLESLQRELARHEAEMLRLSEIDREIQTGLRAMYIGEYELAYEVFRRAAMLDEYAVLQAEGFHYHRGHVRFALGYYADAARDFLDSINRGFAVHASIHNRGVALMRAADDYIGAGLEYLIRAAEMNDNEEIREHAQTMLMLIELDVAVMLEDSGRAAHIGMYNRGLELMNAGDTSWIGYMMRASEMDYDAEIQSMALDVIAEFTGVSRAVVGSGRLSDYINDYYRGIADFEGGNFEAAARYFFQSIQSGYLRHSSTYNRGVSLLMTGDYEIGLWYVYEAAQMDEDPEVRVMAEDLLVQLFQQSTNVAQELSEVEQVLLYGRNALQAGENVRAIEFFTQVMQYDEDFDWLSYYRALARFGLEDYEGAVYDFSLAIQAGYETHRSKYNKGVSLIMANNPETGLYYINLAAELGYDIDAQETALAFIEKFGELVIFALEGEFSAGIEALLASEYAEAEAAFTRAMAIARDYAGLYYYRGVARFAQYDFMGAAEDFSIAMEGGYRAHNSMYNRGVSLIMADELAEGLIYIEHSALLDEDDHVRAMAAEFLNQISAAEAQAELVYLLISAQTRADVGDYEGMLEYLEEYLESVPDAYDIRLIFAQALFASGQFERVVEQCKAILEYLEFLEYGKNENVEYILGLAALQIGDFELADIAFTRAIEGLPRGDDSIYGAHYYRGVARISLGEYRAAISDFTRSIRLDEVAQSSYFNRAVARLMIGGMESATRDDLQHASRMRDDPVLAQQAAELLAEVRSW